MRAARILARGRHLATEFMTDTVQIGFNKPSTELDEHDEYPMVFTPVYDGPARFKAGNVQANDVESASQLLVSQLATLSLPIATSLDVVNGMEVRVTASLTDPALPGTVATVKAPARGAYTTARRFAVEVLNG